MSKRIIKQFKTFKEMEDFIYKHNDYKIVHVETQTKQQKRHLLVMERKDKNELYRK